jgi:hypothetical protein
MRAAILACMLASSAFGGAEDTMLEVEGFAGVPVQAASASGIRTGAISERWRSRETAHGAERIAELELRKPQSPQEWLAGWRRSHDCTAEVQTEPALRLAGAWPQLTVRGSCEGGDHYVMQVVQVESAIIELHVDSTRLDADEGRLIETMRSLLARATIRRGSSR